MLREEREALDCAVPLCRAGGGWRPPLFCLKKKTIATMQGREPGKVTPLQIEPQSRWRIIIGVCVECLIGKQKKPILFKVTEPSSVPYRAPSACAKRAAYPDPPPVIPLPESIAAQAAYQLRYKNTEY